MELRKPVTYGEPIVSAGDFDIFVAALSETDLPTYAVINRVHGVVEHTTENLAYAKDWLSHFVPEVGASGEKEANGNVVNFKKLS